MRPSLPAFRAAATCAAALLAAGAAQAQSSVSLYGLIDVSVSRTQAPGAPATNGIESGKMTTSFWGAKGSEDLGGGLRANFAVESFMRADSASAGRFDGDPFWARSAWVGLATPWGSVSLGRNTTSLFVQTLVFNAFGDAFGLSPSIRHYFTSGTVTGDTGWSDSVKYASPNLGGLSLTAHAALGEGNGGRNGGVSAMYFSGPIGLAAAYQRVSKGATLANTQAWQVAGSYDLKAVKFFGQIGRVDNDATGNEWDITGIGAAVPAGAGKALVQWGRLSPETGPDRDTVSLGYDHFLSKRTDVYAALMLDKLDGLSSGRNYSIGVRHRF